MPRDYARRSQQNKSKPRTGSAKVKVWLLISLLIVVFIMGLSFLRHHSHSTAPKTPKMLSKTTAKAPIPEKTRPAEEKVRFDFYTMLPNTQPTAQPSHTEKAEKTAPIVSAKTLRDAELAVISPVSAPTKKPVSPEKTDVRATTDHPAAPSQHVQITPEAVSPPIAKKSPTIASKRYILQIAAVRHFKDADQLKAQLSLLGYEANVTASDRQGVQWQRVWLGPYATKAKALQIQQALQAQQVKGILLKEP